MKLFSRLALTVVTVGIFAAIASAILYFMGLPIFDEIDIAWIFVYGLVSATIAGIALGLREVWTVE